MATTRNLALAAAAISAALVGTAQAQATRSFRCDDGIRPFTVRVVVVDLDTVRAENIDGRPRTLRLTQRNNGGWTFAGGRGNEYNITINAEQNHASLNKPNSETIECPAGGRAAPPPQQSAQLTSCPPGTVPVPETDNCVPARRRPQADRPANQPGWCRNARNATQDFICADFDLSRLDSVRATAHSRALYDSPRERTNIEREHRRWLSRRDACGPNRPCIERRYNEQIQLLESLWNN